MQGTFEKEVSFLQGAGIKSISAPGAPRVSVIKKSEAVSSSPNTSLIPAERRVLQWQIVRIAIEFKALWSTLKGLIAQFVPHELSHPLIQQCWGCTFLNHQVSNVVLLRKH